MDTSTPTKIDTFGELKWNKKEKKKEINNKQTIKQAIVNCELFLYLISVNQKSNDS